MVVLSTLIVQRILSVDHVILGGQRMRDVPPKVVVQELVVVTTNIFGVTQFVLGGVRVKET